MSMVWNGMNISGIDMDATGKKISKLIEESGITDRELGEAMGLSVQSINKWRHGYNLPDIENLFFLSRILGIKVDDFLVSLEVEPQLVAEAEPDIEPDAYNIPIADIPPHSWTYYIRPMEMYFN